MVPDRLRALVDLTFGPEDEESGEPPGKPTIMGHGDDGSFIGSERTLQRFGASEIQVIGRFIK